jgi:hypothetical protein
MDDNTVRLPLWLRVLAYVIGLLSVTFGAGTVSYLLAKGHIDNIDAAFLIMVLAGLSGIAHVLTLANLNLNSLPSTPIVTGQVVSSEVYNPATDGGLDISSVSGSQADAPDEPDEPPVSGNQPVADPAVG